MASASWRDANRVYIGRALEVPGKGTREVPARYGTVASRNCSGFHGSAAMAPCMFCGERREDHNLPVR